MSSTGPISRAGIESAWQVPLRLSRTVDSTSAPMGPLSLAFGWPLKKYEGDKLEKVQFQIGTQF